jgi:prophage antirepressor-like protein
MNISFNIQQQPDSIYINESGLYSLLISSKNKKPRAKFFYKFLKNYIIKNKNLII